MTTITINGKVFEVTQDPDRSNLFQGRIDGQRVSSEEFKRQFLQAMAIAFPYGRGLM